MECKILKINCFYHLRVGLLHTMYENTRMKVKLVWVIDLTKSPKLEHKAVRRMNVIFV